jgi:hypothetical protein
MNYSKRGKTEKKIVLVIFIFFMENRNEHLKHYYFCSISEILDTVPCKRATNVTWRAEQPTDSVPFSVDIQPRPVTSESFSSNTQQKKS